MSRFDLLIYGTGGFAREVAWLADQCAYAGQQIRVVGFVEDRSIPDGLRLYGCPVLHLEEARACFPEAGIVGAVGSPQLREQLIQRAIALGIEPASVIHPNLECSSSVSIAPGAVICSGNIFTTDIVLGAFVQINLRCTIGHDVRMGRYSTLAPGVHVSGWVHIGERVHIGTGAVVINGTADHPLIIGDDAVVGAGACVTRSVDPRATVVGVPARPIPSSVDTHRAIIS